MANIQKYIDKYGDISFDEKPFNELDNIIFSALEYLEFEGIVPHNSKTKVGICEVIKGVITKENRKITKKNIGSLKNCFKILKALDGKKRYKDLKFYNYTYICDKDIQFSAIFIDFTKKYTYVSFEGTDMFISGWKEDFQMSYKFPVPSQKAAINYINRKIYFSSTRKYIFGGHSKGGNLALVAAMYSLPYIKLKISNIYCNDSPGLLKKQYYSLFYESIKKKVISIVPDCSVVGLILNQKDADKVIKSSKKGFRGHDLYTWQVEDDHFVTSSLSRMSKTFKESLIEWLREHNHEERKELVSCVFTIFEKCGIVSLNDFRESTIKKLRAVLKEFKNIDENNKKKVSKFITFLRVNFKAEKEKAKKTKEESTKPKRKRIKTDNVKKKKDKSKKDG